MTVLPERIDTDRLVLRPFRLADVDDVLAYASDPEWARFMRSPPYDRDDAERAVAAQMTLPWTTRPNWAFVLDGTVVGGLTLLLDLEDGLAEVGYSVGRAYWNRGLCTEALRSVLELAYATYEELNRIHARTDPSNMASQRVLEKVGMSREGVLRACRVVDGVAFDEVSFSVLRTELNG